MTEQPLPDGDDDLVDGDAATYLEALGIGGGDEPLLFNIPTGAPPGEALPLEIVGEHVRLVGNVNLGHFGRLTDFANQQSGLIRLRDVTVLRRSGERTRVTSPSVWINPKEVTLMGETGDVYQRDPSPSDFREKRAAHLIVVTPGHTLTGTVHLFNDALLAFFLESREPSWIPMTDVRTRSLADRRIITRYSFALINRKHVVAATELQANMVRGR